MESSQNILQVSENVIIWSIPFYEWLNLTKSQLNNDAKVEAITMDLSKAFYSLSHNLFLTKLTDLIKIQFNFSVVIFPTDNNIVK